VFRHIVNYARAISDYGEALPARSERHRVLCRSRARSFAEGRLSAGDRRSRRGDRAPAGTLSDAGEWRLMRGDRAKAKEALEAAKATCPQSLYEYDGAVAELGRIDR
jgi:hypothetical protein